MDEAQLRSFLALHSEYFDLMHRTPTLARLEASNMLFHITRSLEQAVEQKPMPDALGPPRTRLVLLAGHDTNLAGVAALLGLQWTLDAREDDTPPGTELAFELWLNDHGIYSVRVTVAIQTLRQLREMPNLTLESPPAYEALSIPECSARHVDCSWQEFQKIADGQ